MNDKDNERLADEPNQKESTSTPAPVPAPEEAQRFTYSLVLAEVVYQAGKTITSHRVQLFSKADVATFPAARLGKLQNSAAHQVQNEVTEKDIKVLEVIILNILPLGWMTDEEFWGSRAAIPGANATMQESPKPNPTPSIHDNVVSLKRT